MDLLLLDMPMEVSVMKPEALRVSMPITTLARGLLSLDMPFMDLLLLDMPMEVSVMKPEALRVSMPITTLARGLLSLDMLFMDPLLLDMPMVVSVMKPEVSRVLARDLPSPPTSPPDTAISMSQDPTLVMV